MLFVVAEFKTFVFKNGDVYEGEWNGDEMEGYGIYTYAGTGNRYEGYYRNHLKHGYGELSYLWPLFCHVLRSVITETLCHSSVSLVYCLCFYV